MSNQLKMHSMATLLLLLLAAVTTASPAPAPAPAPVPAFSLEEDNIAITVPPEMLMSSLSVQTCWGALLETEGCVADMARSISGGQQFRISPKCCRVIEGLGEYCVGNPPFFNIVKALCDLTSG